jgi:hypothetical protein
MLFALFSLALAAPSTFQAPPLPVCSDIALLVKYDYTYVQTHHCALCGKAGEEFCTFDWPFNDVPSCSALDELRNGIYAYYGRPFESARWQSWVAKLDWYKADPAYADSRLSPEAQRNVAYLKESAEAGRGCTK